jgi:hypothetical protein
MVFAVPEGPCFHLRESVSRSDEMLAAQIANGHAPCWAMCVTRWPSGILTSWGAGFNVAAYGLACASASVSPLVTRADV